MLDKQSIAAMLGPVDDRVAAEIIATGASKSELVEARAWMENDEALVNQMRALPKGRVAALVEILERLEAEAEEPDVERS
jgi:hypothetical protein